LPREFDPRLANAESVSEEFVTVRNQIAAVASVVVVACLAGAASGQSPGAAPAPPLPPGIVRQIKVLSDQAPDCTSLKSIAESVTRGCRNNDEKAIAIYNFMQLTHYHRQYPSEAGGLPVLKEIHCYGWSLCGGLHAEQSALWRQLGWDWRFVGWDGHTTVEANYDGRWHYLDVFLKFYAWMPDGRGGQTIVGEDDLNDNAQSLIRDAFILDERRGCVYRKDNPPTLDGAKANWRAPVFLTCGDTLPEVINGLKTHRGRDHSEGWAGINHADGTYSAEVNLAAGFSLENTWDPILDAWYWPGQKVGPAHTCAGHKDTRNDPGIGLILQPYINSKPARSYGNGILTFAPDFAHDTLLKSFVSMENVRYADKTLVPVQAGHPATVVFSLTSPYVLVKASGEATGADAVEVSVDDGTTFNTVSFQDFSAAVQGLLTAFVKVSFRGTLKALWCEAIVQNNPGALPYLSPGKNLVSVSVANPQALGDK
jgi:hypothetical protein